MSEKTVMTKDIKPPKRWVDVTDKAITTRMLTPKNKPLTGEEVKKGADKYKKNKALEERRIKDRARREEAKGTKENEKTDS